MAETKVEGVNKSTQFTIDPRILEIEEGFNARPIDPAHVAQFKVAIKNGATIPPMFVRVEEGRVIVVDGHHRHAAYMELIAEGVEIKRIDVMQFRGNDAERITLMLTSAQGKPLTPLEMGFQYKKLIAFGWTAAEIGNKVGKGQRHVDDMVFLANAPSAVHAMIRDGAVSASLALDMVRRHGDDAAEFLKQSHEKVREKGGTKVTKKAIGESKKQKSENAAVAAINFAIGADDGIEFLRCWVHGEVDEIKTNWPDCPEACFKGLEVSF